MRYFLAFITSVLILSSPTAMASSVIEKPLFNLIQGMPEGQNLVGGYVSFGTFRDGLPAIQLVSVGVAQFFVREARPGLLGLKEYNRWEIHCPTGVRRITGNNDANNIRSMTHWENGTTFSVNQGNQRNRSVYHAICKTVGLSVNWK